MQSFISLTGGLRQIIKKMPWINFKAIRFLNSILKKDMKVFEYGSGGSTQFFMHRVCELITVEHDEAWFNLVQQKIKKNHENLSRLLLTKPFTDNIFSSQTTSDPDAYLSGDSRYRGMLFSSYVKAIENYPDQYFDVVFIDGRARPSCLKHAVPKVKNGGWVLLDYAERDYYAPSFVLLKKNQWKQTKLSGPVPFSTEFSTTIFWMNQGTRIF